MFPSYYTYELIIFHENQTTKNLTKGEVWSTTNRLKFPSSFIAGHAKAALLLWLYLFVVDCFIFCFICYLCVVCDVNANAESIKK